MKNILSAALIIFVITVAILAQDCLASVSNFRFTFRVTGVGRHVLPSCLGHGYVRGLWSLHKSVEGHVSSASFHWSECGCMQVEVGTLGVFPGVQHQQAFHLCFPRTCPRSLLPPK